MAVEKVTYKLEADYAKLSEGYRRIKQEMAESQRLARQAANEAKALVKEQERVAREAEKAKREELRATLQEQKAKEREAASIARETAREQRAIARETAREQREQIKETTRERREAMKGALAMVREEDKERREATRGIFSMKSAMDSAGDAAVAMVTGLASISTVKQIISDVADGIKRVADESDRTAKAMMPLSVQTAGGKDGLKVTKEARLVGAGMGLNVEETGMIANTIKSLDGADLNKELATAGMLKNLGVEGQDTAPIVQAGVVRGMGGARAAEMALTASDLAPWAPKDVAKVMPKTLGYSSMEQGLAAGAALRKAGIPIDQMPSSVEALGRTLTKDESKLAKKFGLKGLPEDQRIAKLSAAADASGDREKFLRTMPEKYDLGEEEGRALRATLSVGDKYQTSLAAISATPAGSLNERFDKAVMQDPIARAEFEKRRASEVLTANKEMGPIGDYSRAQRAATQADAMSWQRNMPTAIGALGMNGDGGLNILGRTATGLTKMGQQPETYQQAEARLKAESVAMSEDTAKKLTAALEANTGATEKNTQSTGGGEAASTSAPATRDRNAGL